MNEPRSFPHSDSSEHSMEISPPTRNDIIHNVTPKINKTNNMIGHLENLINHYNGDLPCDYVCV